MTVIPFRNIRPREATERRDRKRFISKSEELQREVALREADSLINAWALPPMTEEMAERIRESF